MYELHSIYILNITKYIYVQIYIITKYLKLRNVIYLTNLTNKTLKTMILNCHKTSINQQTVGI